MCRRRRSKITIIFVTLVIMSGIAFGAGKKNKHGDRRSKALPTTVTPTPKAPSKNQEKTQLTTKPKPKVKTKPKIKVQYRWISPTGKPVKRKWKTKSQWIWKESQRKTKTYQRPVLRTFVRFPHSIRYQTGEGDDLEFIKNPDNAPFEAKEDRLIAIDTFKPTTTSTLRLTRKLRKSRKKKKDKIIEMGLLISDRSKHRILMVHDSCDRLGLRVTLPKKKKDQGFSFLAAYCEAAKKESIYVHFYTQSNAKFKEKLKSKKKRFESGWVRHLFKKPKPSKTPKKEEKPKKGEKKKKKEPRDKPPTKKSKKKKRPFDYMGKVKVTSPRGKAIYEIYYHPKDLSGFRGFAGLGGTYLIYSETTNTGTVDLNTMTLTLKGGASYFFNRKLDAGISFYANVLNLTSSVTPSSSPSAQFLGINGRVGYTLIDKPSWTFRALAGWYYWRMFVSDQSYGISSLLGPQIVFLNLFPAAKGRKWWFYIKAAPIFSGTGGFSFSSREIALGVGFPIGNPKHKLSLTLDFSQLSISASATPNQPTLLTVSLGTQISF